MSTTELTGYDRCRAIALEQANGAPLPTYRQALELVRGEYAYKLYRDGIGLLSRGSDGGMHYRGDVHTLEDARAWVKSKTEDYARRIADDEVTGTLLFWGGSGWYIG